ncbi:MAG: GLPGLI family protein [Algibacter sp.]|uniref:GLPGLI family protein n=1 Tax=Algibacter sp. TaxID=1872428 RepID=UPI0032976B2C
MKNNNTTVFTLIFIFIVGVSLQAQQEFQGKAYYFSKTTMDLSRFNRGGEQMTEQRKKELETRFKSMLEKTYVLTFNKEESIFVEDEKLSSPVSSGRGFGGFASSFAPGPQYKNIKDKVYLQDQEFFGKQFLIKEDMEPLEWVMGKETKQIGQYLCFKATAKKVSNEVGFGPPRPNNNENSGDETENKTNKNEPEIVEVVAWYTPQIPVSQGPADYWGLPGLILEVNAGDNVMLCSKIVINPEEKTEIKAPKKGSVVTQAEYKEIVTKKMEEFRANRGGGNGRQGGGRR